MVNRLLGRVPLFDFTYLWSWLWLLLSGLVRGYCVRWASVDETSWQPVTVLINELATLRSKGFKPSQRPATQSLRIGNSFPSCFICFSSSSSSFIFLFCLFSTETENNREIINWIERDVQGRAWNQFLLETRGEWWKSKRLGNVGKHQGAAGAGAGGAHWYPRAESREPRAESREPRGGEGEMGGERDEGGKCIGAIGRYRGSAEWRAPLGCW